MNTNHTDTWDRLCELAQEIMERERIPGASIGLLRSGESVTAGFGVTSVENPLPVTGETLFQIGSITKTFTCTAVMRLVETGKLDLDATVRMYIPDFQVADETAASKATIRHLLTHTAGWAGDFFHDTGAGDDACARYVADMADLEQIAPIGTAWAYNNAGFYLLGYVIEMVTGKPYEEALKDLVLDPLGLNNCYFDPGDVMLSRFAVGHEIENGRARVARPWPLPRAAYAAGGITGHVKDLLQYARFHLGDGSTPDGGRLLSPETISLMQSPQVNIWDQQKSVGLAWFIEDENGTKRVQHGGGTIGQDSSLVLVPEHRFAIVILTNAYRGAILTRDVRRWALKQYLGVQVKDPTSVDASKEDLLPYVGRYRCPFSAIDIGLVGDKLIGVVTYKAGFPTEDAPPLSSPAPMTLALHQKDSLVVTGKDSKGQRWDFIRKEDGSIGWLRAGARLHLWMA